MGFSLTLLGRMSNVRFLGETTVPVRISSFTNGEGIWQRKVPVRFPNISKGRFLEGPQQSLSRERVFF
jgi:hypothetical protein